MEAISILGRVKVRLSDMDVSDELLEEFITSVSDRVNLRAAVSISDNWDVPKQLHGIVVDAVVKMARRINYEGITSEGAANINTSFVDDILAEYDSEIAAYKSLSKGRVVKFI